MEPRSPAGAARALDNWAISPPLLLPMLRGSSWVMKKKKRISNLKAENTRHFLAGKPECSKQGAWRFHSCNMMETAADTHFWKWVSQRIQQPYQQRAWALLPWLSHSSLFSRFPHNSVNPWCPFVILFLKYLELCYRTNYTPPQSSHAEALIPQNVTAPEDGSLKSWAT